MGKEEARVLLDYYITGRKFPIKDTIVISHNVNGNIEDYTFKGLLKIAYGLEDSKPLYMSIINELQDLVKNTDGIKLILLGKSDTIRFIKELGPSKKEFNNFPLHEVFEGIPVLGLDSFEGIETY